MSYGISGFEGGMSAKKVYENSTNLKSYSNKRFEEIE